MSLEPCYICCKDSTPWFHIDGHICQDCYENSQGNKWISVKDKLPSNKDMVLVYQYDGISWDITVASYRDTTAEPNCWLFHEGYCNNVTHWMPLPSPPIEDANG